MGKQLNLFTILAVLRVPHQQTAFSMKLLYLQKWEGKSPLSLFPNKASIIKPFSLFCRYFPLMPETGANLQTSLDGLHYRDVYDANYNRSSHPSSLARLQYVESTKKENWHVFLCKFTSLCLACVSIPRDC